MVELTQTTGVGVTDLQRAALTESRRLMREAKGSRRVATGLAFARLSELGWISATERDVLSRMHEIGAQDDGPGRPVSTAAYLQVRGMYDELLTKGDTGPVALALAAGAVGSYEAVQGEDGETVVYAKSSQNYQGLLGAAGAIIGGAIGGAAGAAIGGAIGGVVGAVVDDCKD